MKMRPNRSNPPRGTSRQRRSVLRRIVRDRRGFALVAVMMIGIVGSIIALASAVMAMSNGLVQSGSDRTALVDDAAISGLEETRSRLNAKLDSVPLNGYATLETDKTIPGTNMRRSVWISRLGNSDSLRTVGEYGVQAEVVVKVVDTFGNVAIRRSQLFQDSFARYATFQDVTRSSAGTALYWAQGMTAQGPVHANDTLRIYPSSPMPQAIFKDEVTTTRVVQHKEYASFVKTPREGVAKIALPSTGDLTTLKTIAAKAGYVFTPNVVTGDSALATMRIEFVAIDVNGDGDTTDDNEGFFKVYQLLPTLLYGPGYTIARGWIPPVHAADVRLRATGATAVDDTVLFSYNCGEVDLGDGDDDDDEDEDGDVEVKMKELIGTEKLEQTKPTYAERVQERRKHFDHVNSRCFLGGDSRLDKDGKFRATDPAGYWMARTSGTLPAALNSRKDKNYLWPLGAANNPNFRGVIFAEGRVAVSGVVRGRVTIAARSNIVIAHELVQATSPAVTTGTCKAEDDVIGLFAGEYVLYADNLLQTPQRRREGSTGATWGARKEMDPSPRRPDLAVHASVLALKSVGTENANPPAGLPAASYVNRGFVRMVGGTIEAYNGQIGTIGAGGTMHGYRDDISFNRCLLQYPPPYFPTTGRWSRSQYYEVNPQGFSAAAWFAGR